MALLEQHQRLRKGPRFSWHSSKSSSHMKLDRPPHFQLITRTRPGARVSGSVVAILAGCNLDAYILLTKLTQGERTTSIDRSLLRVLGRPAQGSCGGSLPGADKGVQAWPPSRRFSFCVMRIRVRPMSMAFHPRASYRLGRAGCRAVLVRVCAFAPGRPACFA